MNNLPKFIRIEKVNGDVHYLNVNYIVEVGINDKSQTIKFWQPDGHMPFDGDDYPTAKAAWLEYWKVSP